jgi:hypothetical protein
MSGRRGPTKPSSGPGAGVRAGGAVAPCPQDASTTSGNRIDIVFDPAKSTKATKCEKIVHVQFVRRFGDGAVITPSAFAGSLRHKDADTTAEGWCVDSLASETTPDYQQSKGGDGKKNGGSASATMSDAPQTGGGDKGFYNATSNPGGWRSHRKEFYAYAYCMKGPDCGKWYEGLHWDYTKTWEDQRDGKLGTSTILDKNVTTGPDAGLLAAFDKFNENKGFEPCK